MVRRIYLAVTGDVNDHGLPTEAEWDWTSPGGSYPEGVSPYGAMDMAGNVAEYVSDSYSAGYYYDPSAFDNPQGPHAAGGAEPDISGTGEIEYIDNRVIRGGSFGDDPLILRTFDRRSTADFVGSNYYANFEQKTGFRCAGDVN